MGMPRLGPICSARSSDVARGFPTRRLRIFMRKVIQGTLLGRHYLQRVRSESQPRCRGEGVSGDECPALAVRSRWYLGIVRVTRRSQTCYTVFTWLNGFPMTSHRLRTCLLGFCLATFAG